MMITGVSIVTVWVLDQDSAKEFYTKKLGFDLTNDIQLDGGMRWLTVRSPGSQGQDFLLLDPASSMLDADTAAQVRALVAKGALSPGVMGTTDCRADYDALTERGVEFIQPPAERPYGIEAILRDDSGNWFSFTQRGAAFSA
jgi:catechol 2,3-dioxygenase-like lactoylglutathione lyase family enzyme